MITYPTIREYEDTAIGLALTAEVGARLRDGSGRGMTVYIADYNIELDEVGVFAVPCRIASNGMVCWLLVDGTGHVCAKGLSLQAVCRWVADVYGDKASLTEVARACLQ